jgi:long-chain acyl-CoA synthetase
MSSNSLKDLIIHRVSKFKKSVFIFPEEREEVYTYQDLMEKIREISLLFQELEISKNKVISTLLYNSSAFILIWFSAMFQGITITPLNPEEETSSIKLKISDCKPEAVFMDSNLKEKFLNEIKPLVPKIILVDRNNNFSIIKKGRGDGLELPGTAEIIYTSGSTGKPKGCMLTPTNMIVDVKGISEWQKFNRNTRMLCTLPLFHVSAQIISVLSVFYSGGDVVVVKKFSSKSFWNIIKKYEVNVTNVVPTILIHLLNTTRHSFRRLKPTSLTRILCGAAPLPVEVIKKFEKTFEIPIVQTYGLTEGTCVSTSNPIEPSKRKLSSVGLPLSINEVIIVDERGRKLAPFKVGEVCIKGENVFCGYLNDPLLTKDVLKDGWLYTGDLGYMDEENFLYLVGRKKEVINRGGEKISPIEIENVVYQIPEVLKVLAVGVEDEIYGEHPALVIECKPGIRLTPGLKRKIREHCVKSLATFKQPKEILSVKSLGWTRIPSTPSGKFLRREVKERLNQYLKLSGEHDRNKSAHRE